MNPQEVFNQVIAQMAKQGGPCIDTRKNRCVMHLPQKGRYCPGGFILKEDLDRVQPEYEAYPYNQIIGRQRELGPGLGHRGIQLVTDLQTAHDDSARHGLEAARREFTAVAERYKLAPGKVMEIKRWDP